MIKKFHVGTKLSKNIWKQMEGRIGRLSKMSKRQKRWNRMNNKEKMWDYIKNGPLETLENHSLITATPYPILATTPRGWDLYKNGVKVL